MRGLYVAAVLATSALLVGGCFIFTGSTDGYTSATTDSGASADGAATCDPDATCVALTCLGASDCDAGEVCCLSSVSGGLGSVCQSNCVDPQLCQSASECTGGSCTSQSCTSNGVSLVVQACTTIPGCTP